MQMAEHPLHHSPPLDVATELALARTRAAYERTMMSWIRTATSLITFGFSIYKFFQLENPSRLQARLIGPRQFALVLVCLGLLSLVLAIVEHRHNVTGLEMQSSIEHRSLAMLLAILISILGILALIVMIFRQ
jgi:putative membrane protein